jgi:hypothetical protein
MTGSRSRNWAGFGELSGRTWFQVVKNAKARHLEITIDGDYAWELYKRQNGKCALTGVDIGFVGKTPTASLDRIDSKKGYVPGNLQWVHKVVNMMKGTLSVDELAEWSKLIFGYNEHRKAIT